jgi:hypothetical protein
MLPRNAAAACSIVKLGETTHRQYSCFARPALKKGARVSRRSCDEAWTWQRCVPHGRSLKWIAGDTEGFITESNGRGARPTVAPRWGTVKSGWRRARTIPLTGALWRHHPGPSRVEPRGADNFVASAPNARP